MGVDKHSSKSGGGGGGGYVGGFLQLFDWNGKSRKKLLAKSQEGSKQGKRNVGNSPTSRFRLIDEDENGGSSIRGSSDYSCASSVTDDDGNVTKAPGVVARLMGLDSLPTSSVAEPYSTLFCDTQSLGESHSYRRSEYYSESQTMNSEYQPTTSGDLGRYAVETRLQKLHCRPIERFQTEMLPPKLAKSIPITHHKLLSPIKNPGFIPSKNASDIMEAVAKIIEPGPQPSGKRRAVSVGSSSVPLQIRDSKEKMEAIQRPRRLNGASHKSVESNAAKLLIGQSMNKSWNGSEEPNRFRASSGSDESYSVGLRNKGKSVSLAVQAKVNIQHRESFGSGNRSKSLNGPKESQDIKSNQLQRSRSSVQKTMQKKSSPQNSSTVLKQNNQKQNCAATRDKLPSKPTSNLQSRRTISGDGRNRSLTKEAAQSKVGSKKSGTDLTGMEKETSSFDKMNLPRKKRYMDSHFERRAGVVQNVLAAKDERPIQRGMSDSRTKGMDVISFTFTSPMIKSTPGSQTCSPIVDKAKSYALDSYDDRCVTKSSKLSNLGVNVIGGDSLSILLERKLRELTYGVESSCKNSGKSGGSPISTSILQDLASALNAVETTPRECEKRSHLGMHVNDSLNEGVEEMDLVNSHSRKGRKELECQHPSPMSILDPTFSYDSSNSSDAVENNVASGCKQSSFIQTQQAVDSKCSMGFPLTEVDAELSDSASSTFMVATGNKNVANLIIIDQQNSNKQEELGYIMGIICNAELVFKDFMLGQINEILKPGLFEQLENQITWSVTYTSEKNSTQRRMVLFDCVKESLNLRCTRLTSGGRGMWEKGVSMFVNKEWLVEDIYKEISGWESMIDWMMDELVDKDMSTQYGRWLDYKTQEFEVGVKVVNSIVGSLIDEVVADILLL
ncbi:hypothetical protein MKW94_013681 [Papaver nudicaule]|uniref:DUF4378 domain-containing protein n=1 Tax=Papaver nudicaule TaxID=74823 RepID=A0AA41VBG0_PAPNU|nr:hypothetical protein [Papaver nudicaule]